MEIKAISVGNRPLQGTRALVRIAIRRSRGLWMMRQPHHAHRVAAKPHAHAKRLLAAGAAALKAAVQMESYTREESQILQQRKERKEDRHGRQHDGHHPAGYAVYARYQRLREPLGSPQTQEPGEKAWLKSGQRFAQPRRRHVGARYGQVQHQPQQRQHERNANVPGGPSSPVDAELAQIR